MKLLRDILAIIALSIFIGFAMYCVRQEHKMKHEYKMELLKQGKVSIESIE